MVFLCKRFFFVPINLHVSENALWRGNVVMSRCLGSKFLNDNKPKTLPKKLIRTVSDFVDLI